MTQEEEKELLLKDLSARLPYGVKIMFASNGFRWDWEQTLEEIRQCEDGEYAINGWGIHGIKPYLRPMSSMTEEEDKEYTNIDNGSYFCPKDYAHIPASNRIDWLNAHHFDYRRLIEKSLAIKVTEENNPYKNEND